MLALLAQASQAVNTDKNKSNNDNDTNDDEFVDIDPLDLDELVDPKPRALSTTQIGMWRLESSYDTYQPSTLLPPLYQMNPFSRQQNDEDLGGDAHELTAQDMLVTTKKIQDMDEEEADEIALLQAVETMLATTRAGRKRKATMKVVENDAQATDAKRAKTSSRGGRGGHGGRGDRKL
jgi:hypothetical protein